MSQRNHLAPVVKAGADGNEESTHPAFGFVRMFRTSGAERLFGSNFVHQHYISIEVGHATGTRRYNADGHRANEPVVRFAISEAQFCSMITSTGSHEGTPVTLQRLGREGLPGISPPEVSTTQKVRGEARAQLDGVMADLARVEELLEASGLSKAKLGPVLQLLRGSNQRLGGGLDFILQTFGEEMEKTVSKAEAEIRGTINASIQQYAIGTAAYQREGEPVPQPPVLALDVRF